jgi:hypothetical protein
MKTQILLSILFVSSLFSCKKENVVTPETKPESISFLNKKTDDFDGEYNGKRYTWEITNAIWYIIADIRYVVQGNNTNGKNQSHYFRFGANGCDAKAEIHTPYYDNPSKLFSEILTVGKKKIGPANDAFNFEVTIPIGHLQTYNCVGNHTTNGDQTGSYLEILSNRLL